MQRTFTAPWRTRLALRAPLWEPLYVQPQRFLSAANRAKSQKPKNYRSKEKEKGRKPHWSDRSRLAATKKYPLSVELAKLGIRPDPIHSTRGNIRMRSQIVSPNLCDDVLKYMGHTLEEYKGCDIIDFNPGVCLWSQKLHEFLQPRTHVLLEGSPEMWRDYQQPLLDKRGSRYRLFEGDTKAWETLDRLWESGILPPHAPVEPSSPEAQRPNRRLLVTGTLMWDPPAKGMGFDSLSRQLLKLWAEGAWRNTGIHKHGLARSLVWMPEQDAGPAVPRSHYMYSKYSVAMNYLAKNVQVVTPGHAAKGSAYDTIGRRPQYEIQSVIRAMKRGRDNGMELLAHRREAIHDFADDIAQRNISAGKDADARLSMDETHKYLAEQAQAGKATGGIDYQASIAAAQASLAMETHPERYHSVTLSVVPKKAAKGIMVTTKNEEGALLSKIMSTNNSDKRRRVTNSEWAKRAEAVYDRECEILAMEDGPEKEAAKQEVEDMQEQLDDDLQTIIRPYRTGALSEANDRIAMKSPVPRLQWDDRPYEPLVMNENEVWPPMRASLIDSEPYPLPPDRDPDWFEWVQDFAFSLINTPSAPVTKALDAMQSGASSLVDEVPALKDPARGGRLNLDQFKVSMLTNEMIDGLCRAYVDWPFKDSQAVHPRYFQMRSKGGRNLVDRGLRGGK